VPSRVEGCREQCLGTCPLDDVPNERCVQYVLDDLYKLNQHAGMDVPPSQRQTGHRAPASAPRFPDQCEQPPAADGTVQPRNQLRITVARSPRPLQYTAT
jgi:hypothetical protein